MVSFVVPGGFFFDNYLTVECIFSPLPAAQKMVPTFTPNLHGIYIRSPFSGSLSLVRCLGFIFDPYLTVKCIFSSPRPFKEGTRTNLLSPNLHGIFVPESLRVLESAFHHERVPGHFGRGRGWDCYRGSGWGTLWMKISFYH